ncbi:MAG TPA: hypothetical protein VEQ58_10355 [Polyangiaceae bacterium]|nr:hypothetical protein [Polyangiaceae bacterium]
MALRAVVFWGVVVASLGVACGESSGSAPRMIPSAGGDCAACAGEPGAAGVPSAFIAGEGGGLAEGGVPNAAAGEPSVPVLGGGGSGGDESAAGEAGAPMAAPADLSLQSITITQTVEIPLMKAGSAIDDTTRPVPLIAGKRALVRAFVRIEAWYTARALVGVLDIDTGASTRSVVSQRTIVTSSKQDDLASSFVFDVAADDVTAGSSYRVRVLEADTTPLLRFPDVGYASLSPRVLAPFELVIVPFIVNGFAPKTSELELSALSERLRALYPSSEIALSIADPVTIGYVVNADGDGWDEALDEVYKQRADAHPDADVFYYGLMAPALSYDDFCPNGCTVGLSVVAPQNDVDSRGSLGVGVFQDGSGADDAWDTLAHELGHALGRKHTPCGDPLPEGLDSKWPTDDAHDDASLGLYGYDFDLGRLIRPWEARDVMSYCTPVGMSDYTYAGIFKRLDYIQNQSRRVLDSAPPEASRLARIRRDGQSSWLAERHRNGTATPQTVQLLDAAGRSVGQAQAEVVPLDHRAGGYVWFRARELQVSGAVSVDLRPLGGGLLAL